MPISKQRKAEYFNKLESLVNSYSKIFIVVVDNVGSNQLQQIRIDLRGEGVILMGKNTMIRRILTMFAKAHHGHPIEQLIPRVVGNVGFVFTNGDLHKIRTKIEGHKVPAPARVGAISPIDVIVPPGPTGCDPGQTNFFQTLQIATKITKGQIEIVNPVPILKKGDKVGNSEATLLQKLNIKPFTYGLSIESIYDSGSVFDAAVLDLTDEDMQKKFVQATRIIAALSLALGLPTAASVPHSVANAYKTLLAITVQLENYTFPKAEEYKNFLKNPGAFAAVAAAPAAGAAAAAAAPAAKEEKKEEEEDDLGGGMDMFGGGKSEY